MQLKVISSSSAGNCYILENEKEALIIEAGVRFEKIKQALNFNLNKVIACLVTHEHGDHAKAVHEVLAAGIKVFASAGTHKAIGSFAHHNAMVNYRINIMGGFQFKPFDVKHDAAEPVGYLINHADCGNVLFLTDSYYSEYTFSSLNNVIIEANYCQNILDERLQSGSSPAILRDRVIQSHMSIDTCVDMLRANDLSQVNNIVLIHLSDKNSDAVQFKKRVQEATGKTVYVADVNQTFQLNKTPF